MDWLFARPGRWRARPAGRAQPTPTKKSHKAKSAQAAQPSAGQPAQQAPPAGPHAGKPAKEHAAAPNKPHAHAPATEPTDTGANSNDAMKAEQKKSHKGQPVASESANTAHAPEATNPRQNRSPEATAITATSEQASQPKPGKGKAKQVDVQKIKTQHANFRAQPKPQQVAAVTFNESRQISGSEHVAGHTIHRLSLLPSAVARPELVSLALQPDRAYRGGSYFFNAGYWYPAWGYQHTAQILCL